MNDTYIIETRKGAAGIVVRDGRGFRFFAATRDFNCLDGLLFATPKAAEVAAIDCVNGSKARTKAREIDAMLK
jgi:hypothetical protein